MTTAVGMYDSFDRTDSGALGYSNTGLVWVQPAGLIVPTGGEAQTSATVPGSSTGVHKHLALIDAAATNGLITANIVVGQVQTFFTYNNTNYYCRGAWTNLVFWYQDDNNQAYLQVYSRDYNGATAIRLHFVSGGTDTNILLYQQDLYGSTGAFDRGTVGVHFGFEQTSSGPKGRVRVTIDGVFKKFLGLPVEQNASLAFDIQQQAYPNLPWSGMTGIQAGFGFGDIVEVRNAGTPANVPYPQDIRYVDDITIAWGTDPQSLTVVRVAPADNDTNAPNGAAKLTWIAPVTSGSIAIDRYQVGYLPLGLEDTPTIVDTPATSTVWYHKPDLGYSSTAGFSYGVRAIFSDGSVSNWTSATLSGSQAYWNDHSAAGWKVAVKWTAASGGTAYPSARFTLTASAPVKYNSSNTPVGESIWLVYKITDLATKRTIGSSDSNKTGKQGAIRQVLPIETFPITQTIDVDMWLDNKTPAGAGGIGIEFAYQWAESKPTLYGQVSTAPVAEEISDLEYIAYRYYPNGIPADASKTGDAKKPISGLGGNVGGAGTGTKSVPTPALVQVKSATTNSATLSWKAPKGATVSSYKLVKDDVVVATVSASTKEYTFTGLTENLTYRLGVFTHTSKGDSLTVEKAVKITPMDSCDTVTQGVGGADGKVSISVQISVDGKIAFTTPGTTGCDSGDTLTDPIQLDPGTVEGDLLTLRRDGNTLLVIVNGKIICTYTIDPVRFPELYNSGAWIGFYNPRNNQRTSVPSGGSYKYPPLTGLAYKLFASDLETPLGFKHPLWLRAKRSQSYTILFDSTGAITDIGFEMLDSDVAAAAKAYRGGSSYVVDLATAQAIADAGYMRWIEAVL